MPKKKKELVDEHPSLKGYIPSESIPEGYNLKMVSYPSMSKFAVEWLVPVSKENKKAA